MYECIKCHRSIEAEHSICDFCDLRDNVIQMRNEISDLKSELLSIKAGNITMKKESSEQFNNLLSRQIDSAVATGLSQDDILCRMAQQEIRALLLLITLWYVLYNIS